MTAAALFRRALDDLVAADEIIDCMFAAVSRLQKAVGGAVTELEELFDADNPSDQALLAAMFTLEDGLHSVWLQVDWLRIELRSVVEVYADCFLDKPEAIDPDCISDAYAAIYELERECSNCFVAWPGVPPSELSSALSELEDLALEVRQKFDAFELNMEALSDD